MNLSTRNGSLYSRIAAIVALLSFALLSGCATVNDMGVTAKSTKLELDGDGMVLMSVVVNNQFKPDYQPELIVTHVEEPYADSKAQRQNFKMDNEGTLTTTDGRLYLLRMKLKPGKYIVRGATGMYHGILILGTCFLPVHADIDVQPNTVTYIGRATGKMRERVGDEFRSGPVVPLIDQAVTGFANSTFDVTITDSWDEDEKSYRGLFPPLEQVEITKAIMPPFDRARAQAYWDSDGNSEAKATGEATEPKQAGL